MGIFVSHILYRMKVLCVLSVFMAVAWAGPWPDDMAPPHVTVAPYAVLGDIQAYGLPETIKRVVQDMMEAGVALQEKVALITDKVTAVIEVLEKVYEEATANKEEKIEAVIQELCKRLIAEVTNIIEYVFDQIAEVALRAVAKADEMITGMIGEQFIRNQIEKGINTLFTKYIDVILSTLRGILEKIDWIQQDMVDEIIGSIEESLNAKLDALADSLKESLRSKRSEFLKDVQQRGLPDAIKRFFERKLKE